MSTGSPSQIPEVYDVMVIGAGPAGAEAAMAAGRAGAATLCLTINLDTTGFHPATPLLVEDAGDIRGPMLAEMERLGGVLPKLLGREGVTAAAPAGVRGPDAGIAGRVVIDRRNLGLAYKEELESAPGVQLRQALVTSLKPHEAGVADPPLGGGVAKAPHQEGKAPGADLPPRWRLTTKLGESFAARAVVVATGTFLAGVVDDGGVERPGGRLGEIPSNALARSLRELGVGLTQIFSESPPRVDSRTAGGAGIPVITAGEPVTASAEEPAQSHDAGGRVQPAAGLIPDGIQLRELMVAGFWPRGGRTGQLAELRGLAPGLEQAWMTRPAWSVTHLALAAGQVDRELESVAHRGLFFAGRGAGTCNYVEAAVTGLAAGTAAAARATGRPHPDLTNNTKYVDMIRRAVSRQEKRPVTIRVAGPGC